jgi:hypothetical protein
VRGSACGTVVVCRGAAALLLESLAPFRQLCDGSCCDGQFGLRCLSYIDAIHVILLMVAEKCSHGRQKGSRT